MKLYITRDSVAAGDDFDAPHVRKGSVADDADVSHIVEACLRLSPLPNISGGFATWALSSGVPIAVVAQQWSSPKLIAEFPFDRQYLDIANNTLRLHFTYLEQRDPEDVHAVLSELKLYAN